MQQNASITSFTVSDLLMKNQQWGKIIPPPPGLGLKDFGNFKNTAFFASLIAIY